MEPNKDNNQTLGYYMNKICADSETAPAPVNNASMPVNNEPVTAPAPVNNASMPVNNEPVTAPVQTNLNKTHINLEENVVSDHEFKMLPKGEKLTNELEIPENKQLCNVQNVHVKKIIIKSRYDYTKAMNEIFILDKLRYKCDKYILCYVSTIVINGELNVMFEETNDYANLAEFISLKKHRSIVDTIAILNNIYQAIKTIHSYGIFHLNIHPDNIIFDITKNDVKIRNFEYSAIDMGVKIDFSNYSYNDQSEYINPSLFRTMSDPYHSSFVNIDMFSFYMIQFYILSGGSSLKNILSKYIRSQQDIQQDIFTIIGDLITNNKSFKEELFNYLYRDIYIYKNNNNNDIKYNSFSEYLFNQIKSIKSIKSQYNNYGSFTNDITNNSTRNKENENNYFSNKQNPDMKGGSIKSDEFFETYNMVSLLGKGGFGSVFKCINKNDNNAFALKTIDLKLLNTNHDINTLITLIKKEIFILDYLRLHCSDYIMCYYNSFIDTAKKKVLISCEILHGSTNNFVELSNFFEYKYKNTNVCDLLVNLQNGLKLLHSLNVVHRDIKPGNIMFNPKTLKIKYIDFGMAELCINNLFVQEVGVVGTPNYLDAETLLDKKKKDFGSLKKCDLFALGMTQFVILNSFVNKKQENIIQTLVGPHNRININQLYIFNTYLSQNISSSLNNQVFKKALNNIFSIEQTLKKINKNLVSLATMLRISQDVVNVILLKKGGKNKYTNKNKTLNKKTQRRRI